MNLDAYKIPIFTIKKWHYLTPSKFTAARSCAWREVLSASVGRQLLPSSPIAWLGSLIHSLIENIINGTITNETDFDIAWRENVKRKEAELVAEGREAWLPLSASIPRFAFKKLQTKAFLKKYTSKNNPILSFKNEQIKQNTAIFAKEEYQQSGVDSQNFKAEQKLIAREGWLLGKADLIVENNQHVDIVDYKTGQIFDDSNILKEDYRAQLLLYAWLYADTHEGKYPNQLTILDLNQTAHNVAFTPDDCEKCADEARLTLEKINNSIDNEQFAELASPDGNTCSSCSMRPVCVFKSHNLVQNWADVEGIIKTIEIAKTGSILRLIILQNDDVEISIHAVPSIWQSILIENIGKKVGLFNLQKAENATFFKWYRQSSLFLI